MNVDENEVRGNESAAFSITYAVVSAAKATARVVAWVLT
jgi:hypothetical protein